MNDKDLERFLKYVQVNGPDECWIWLGSKSINGYGRFRLHGKGHPAHRVFFEHYHGEVPSHLDACHICDNRICVNPNHIFIGTRSDNMRDCANKGRNGMQRYPERSYVAIARKLNTLHQAMGERQGHSKLKEVDIKSILALHKQGKSSTEIGKVFSISPSHIRSIVAGTSWKHITSNIDARKESER